MDESTPSKSWLPNFLRRKPSSSTLPLPDEQTTLLSKPSTTSTSSQWLHEFLLLLRNSIPVIFAYTLQNSLQTVSILMVGRLSPHALAIAAFSYMFAMSTGWLIALGGSTALDTLASSTFTGSQNPHDLGVLLQRAFVVLTAFYVPVAALWCGSEKVFLGLGQEDWVARGSRDFLLVLAPGGLGYVWFEVVKKFLQAQGHMRPGTYVLLLTSPLNALLNYLLIHTFGLGLLGAPLATGISYWLSFILLSLYAIYFTDSRKHWGGWSVACLKNIGTFARLALLGVIHVGTEWWAFEIVALAAGRLGAIPLAAQSVIMTTDQVLNTIPFGIGVACSARVGNLLGSREAKGAALSAQVAAWLSIAMGLLVGGILMGVKNNFGRLFNDDIEVVNLVARVMPWVAAFQVADGLNGSMGGALRGMGRQHVGAVVNIVSYYGGALPGGIWLAFHGWGLEGLWVGQCVALFLVGGLEWVIVGLCNWEKQVERAFGRMDGARRVDGADGDGETV